MSELDLSPKEIEAKLIVHAIENNDVHKLYLRGVTPDKMLVWGDVLDFVIQYEREYGESPSVNTIALKHSDFPNIVSDGVGVEFLADAVLENYKKKQLREIIEEAVDNIDVSSAKTIDYITSKLSEIGAGSKTRAIYVDSDPDARLEKFLNKRQQMREGHHVGLPTGIHKLDETLMGYLDGDLIVITGPPEVGKSWLLLRSALVTYMAGYPVLFISLEMIEEEVTLRWHTMAGKEFGHTLPNEGLMSGRGIDVDDYRRFLHDKLGERKEFVIVDDVEGGRCTVPVVEGLIREFNPKLILIDSLPLMCASDGCMAVSWQGILDVAYGLKFLATRTKTVIMATTLSDSNTFDRAIPAEMGELGLGRYLAYAIDLGISIADSRSPKEKNLRIFKKRKGKRIEDVFQITFDPNRGAIG